MRRRGSLVVIGLLVCCGHILVACAPGERRGQLDAVSAPSAGQAGVISLPEPSIQGGTPLTEAIRDRRSVRSFEREPLTLDHVSQLLWSAQGVTDEQRGLRAAPSAGATYPLETFVLVGDVEGLAPGVYRYDPDTHRITAVLGSDVRSDMADAALGQAFIEQAPITVLFAAVYERTARRYGARAERYVHMEVGHAAQNLHLQAVALGLGSVPVGAFDDERVAEIAGLAEGEAPLYLIPIGVR